MFELTPVQPQHLPAAAQLFIREYRRLRRQVPAPPAGYLRFEGSRYGAAAIVSS